MNETNDSSRADPVPITKRRSARRAGDGAVEGQRRAEAEETGNPPAEEAPVEESREARIARLKELIERGEYNPDPYEVARAMIEKGF